MGGGMPISLGYAPHRTESMDRGKRKKGMGSAKAVWRIVLPERKRKCHIHCPRGKGYLKDGFSRKEELRRLPTTRYKRKRTREAHIARAGNR